MDSVITSAWDKQKPFVAYYWEPTWLMGKYDLVLLEDSPYDPDTYQDGIGACPAVTVTVAVSNSFAEANPEFCAFPFKLSHRFRPHQRGPGLHAGRGQRRHPRRCGPLASDPASRLIDEWLTGEQAEVLNGPWPAAGNASSNWLTEFPLVMKPDTNAIDTAVRGFAVAASPVLDKIQAV